MCPAQPGETHSEGQLHGEVMVELTGILYTFVHVSNGSGKKQINIRGKHPTYNLCRDTSHYKKNTL